MKFRQDKHTIGEDEERSLRDDVRRLAGTERPPQDPPDAYWQNLLIRSNARIDAASSGRALSISWALRVALPGVIAIVSFLIGLHYYVPEVPKEDFSVAAVVLSLPAATIDSLLVDPSPVDPSLSVAELGVDLFDLSRDQIVDYLLTAGNASAAVEGLTEGERSELLAALGTNRQ
ncbi:MAG: hypothetical protein AB1428_03820 [Bacteroidota bacterium]